MLLLMQRANPKVMTLLSTLNQAPQALSLFFWIFQKNNTAGDEMCSQRRLRLITFLKSPFIPTFGRLGNILFYLALIYVIDYGSNYAMKKFD